MVKAVFRVNNLGAQSNSQNYDEILTEDIFADIAKRLYDVDDFEIIWKNERNVGRLITCEFKNKKAFINLSQSGHVVGRNYYFQSVCTAVGQYIQAQLESKKELLSFYFYFLPFSGENQTDYHKFQYRVMTTAGIKFLNPDFGFHNFSPTPFNTVKDIITHRNDLRGRNSGNKSTYITDEGDCYNMYGKTFGANQKETTLMCLALSAITDKPIKLFQILDNDSKKLSDNDINTINEFDKINCSHGFTILDDSFEFDNDPSDTITDNLRSPKFIYNLLNKYNGTKKCALCGCKIESIIQAAHILPVANIRRRTDLSQTKKIELATDKDNGIWLCENHHKMFDRGLIWFEEGKVCIIDDIDSEDALFIKKITTIQEIEPCYINDRMLAFFDMRAGLEGRVSVY